MILFLNVEEVALFYEQINDSLKKTSNLLFIMSDLSKLLTMAHIW